MDSVPSAVTSGADVISTTVNGDAKRMQETREAAPQNTQDHVPAKLKRKYKHVEALHAQAQPSCLSHEAEKAPSFLGFRNLLVLVVIVMNLRLVLENFKKYGLLISLESNIRHSDIRNALLMYLFTPVHLFVAFMIEKVAMENAVVAVGRRKRSDAGMNAPESEKERKDFYNTWWWIAAAHTINSTIGLLVSSFVVYTLIHNPGIGCICELHAVIVWLKTASYALTNRDLRHAMLHPAYAAALPDMYAHCPYPENISVSNLCYFWWAPTLVYQPIYPRSDKIRWDFVLKRFSEVIGLSVFIWLVVAQYAVPVLHNATEPMARLDILSILERVMKLSSISLISWLAGFFALFQSFLNGIAELLRFGDRDFYGDWWNSPDVRTYWNTWNKPVYHFMRRHIYSPLRGRGWSHMAASAWVFVFSGILHELVIGVPTHNILLIAFAGMLGQLPLIALTDRLSGAGKEGQREKGQVTGNCIFWLSFVLLGQPLAALVYFFAWQRKYGHLYDTALRK